MQVIKQNRNLTQGALSSPEYPQDIPSGAKWLGGEGYGVWFHLSKPKHLKKNEYRIRRYSAKGNLHCDKIFVHDTNQELAISQDFDFAYISHCQQCVIIQKAEIFIFKSIKNYEE